MKAPTVQTVSRIFGCTPKQVTEQYLRNAIALRKMQAKGTGFTREQLDAKAAEFESK